jgi:tetratricopeptide (TPR) repeat protein
MTRARRRERLARVWYLDGDLEEAVKHGRRALLLAEAAESAPSAATAHIALTLALIERDRAAFEAARGHLVVAVGLLEALPVSGHPLLARALIVLADVHRRMGAYREVDDALLRARRLLGDAPMGVLTVEALMVEGIAAKERGTFDEAERCYAEVRRALDLSGARVPAVAALHHNLAGLAYARERYVEAEAHARRALALRRSLKRVAPVDVAQDLAVLASALAGQHRHAEALALFDEATAICQEARPPREYEIAVHLHNVASIHHTLGRFDLAEDLYRRALGIKEALLGAEHPEVCLVAGNLGTLLRDAARR